MRVLITTDTVGGVWTFAQDLASGLLERGCSVLLVSFGRLPSRSQAEQCADLWEDYPGHFRYVATDIPLEWMEENEHVFEAGAQIIRNEAVSFRPDVLHSNQFCYGAIDLSVPIVVTAHSDVLSWARACRNSPLPDTPCLRRYVAMVQRGLDRAEWVSAPTRWMLEALGESFCVHPRRTVIPNGTSVDADFGSPRSPRAVTAGRIWDEAKGIRLLEQVNSPIPIVVAGEPCAGSAHGSEDGGPFTLVGQLSKGQIHELFRTSSIYVCPSVYEPFGLAALEAARCGCAVLTRGIPSLREVWQDAALSFDSADDLAALLRELYQDPQLLEWARRQSFEHAQSFTSVRMVEHYLNLYNAMQARSTRSEQGASSR